MGIESNQYNNVALFLGRIQGLPVRRQNLMFAYLIVRLKLLSPFEEGGSVMRPIKRICAYKLSLSMAVLGLCT